MSPDYRSGIDVGRHPLQTSDALGAAASQIGPDAQTAVVLLNETFAPSHIKMAAVFHALFGITLCDACSSDFDAFLLSPPRRAVRP